MATFRSETNLVKGASDNPASGCLAVELIPRKMAHGKIEILLIEDNVGDVTLFQTAISGYCRITVARNGAEALDRLFQRGRFAQTVRPDLVVLDLNLPLVNGHEVLNAIKSNSKLRSIPAIIFSASSYPRDIEKAYEFGASAYLIKPVQLDKMEAALTSFVDFWIKHVALPGIDPTHAASTGERGG